MITIHTQYDTGKCSINYYADRIKSRIDTYAIKASRHIKSSH